MAEDKEVILALLNKLIENGDFLKELMSNTDETLKGLCLLTKEELEALANADIDKIRDWLNRSDINKK